MNVLTFRGGIGLTLVFPASEAHGVGRVPLGTPEYRAPGAPGIFGQCHMIVAMIRHRILVRFTMGIVVIGASSCGHGRAHVANRTTTTSVTATTIGLPSSEPVASTTTTPNLARCHTTGLSAQVGGERAAAGNIGVTLTLKNASNRPCFLYGYVGLQLDNATRRFLPTRVIRGPSMTFQDPGPRMIILASGEVASAGIGFTDNPVQPVDPTSGCPASTYLEVTPPDETTYLFIPAHLAPCNGGTLDVTALQAGSQPEGP